MFYAGFQHDEFIKSNTEDNWIMLSHKKYPLIFYYRYNVNNDCMMEFVISDHGNQLGQGAQYTIRPDSWLEYFVFKGHFNTWVSQRRMKSH